MATAAAETTQGPNVSGLGDAPQYDTDLIGEVVGYGKIEVVRCADLNVDPKYQRELSRALVDRIKDDWNTAGAGYITVSRRSNGALYIVNGQHRVAARMDLALEQGDETGGEIVAQVFEGLTPQQEAQLRLIGNTKRTDSSQERFRAQLAAGDPTSVAIQSTLREFGTRINPAPDVNTGINAVSAVEAIYEIDNGRTLQRVLETLKDAFGEIGGKSATVGMLKGATWFVARHAREADIRRFVDRLAAVGEDHIERLARNYKAAAGGALWLNYYRAMIEVYNYRLGDGAKLEPRAGGWSKSSLRTGDGGTW
jgi:hypothetical protein